MLSAECPKQMLTRDQAADIFARIRKHAIADEVECLFYGGHSALTRFANNTIHQNRHGISRRLQSSRPRNGQMQSDRLFASHRKTSLRQLEFSQVPNLLKEYSTRAV